MPITRGQERKQVEGTMGRKRGLYDNINARKRAGTSRPKSKSTISPEAYANMKAGFPERKKAKHGGKIVKGPCS